MTITDAARDSVVINEGGEEEAWLCECGCCGGVREGNERENTLRPCHMPSSRHPLCGWIGTTYKEVKNSNNKQKNPSNNYSPSITHLTFSNTDLKDGASDRLLMIGTSPLLRFGSLESITKQNLISILA